MLILMLIRDPPILCIHHAAFALYKISFTHYRFMLQLRYTSTVHVSPLQAMCLAM